jgi:DnaJ-class molecular chaperone
MCLVVQKQKQRSSKPYEVLGNAHKRRAYDTRKTNGFRSYQEEEQTTGSSDDVTADKQAKAAAKKATGSLARFLIGTAMFAAVPGAIILGGSALAKRDCERDDGLSAAGCR